ncbi:DNA topoisomerase family protein [Vibrio ezurae]|nr:topoisomerase DNA-binding C4 zinc finger domain-containing protein [Vibrio ezurae]
MSKINHQLFSAEGHALEQSCPNCGHPLQMRHGKHGAFWGCSNYPSCDYIKSSHQASGQIIKPLGVPCPNCGDELVLRQGRYGMFIGCSAYPDCHYIGSLDEPEDHSVESFVCPECHKGHLIERKSRYGKAFYACDQYPKCQFSINSEPKQGKCQECGFELLMVKKSGDKSSVICASRKCQAKQ